MGTGKQSSYLVCCAHIRHDSGETVALGAKAVLKSVDEGICDDGDIIKLLRKLTQVIDGKPHKEAQALKYEG